MSSPHELIRFEPALLLWAKCQMPMWVRVKLAAEDLVQTTFAEALAAKENLAGRQEHEVLAFLRRALSNNLIDALRKFERNKGDLSPEAAGASSIRLADWIAADHTSPSERASRNERFERLAEALMELPDTQRIAVEMRYLQGMKVGDIAQVLDRTEGAVSLLIHRAVTRLRDVLPEPTM